MSNIHEEILHLMTCSKRRLEILKKLLEGRKVQKELSDELQTRPANLAFQIKLLENSGIVKRSGRTIQLTDTGLLLVKSLEKFAMNIETIMKFENLWKGHITECIPEEFVIRLYQLNNGSVVEASPEDLEKAHRAYLDLVSKSRNLMGVSPIFHPEYVDVFLEVASKGASISLVFTKQVVKKLLDEYMEALKEAEKYDLKLFVYGDEIKVAFTVSERFLSFGLFTRDGEYDFFRDLISMSPEAIQWGMDLFHYYARRSEVLDVSLI
jgi:predicted transcriptional regulator